MPRLKRTNASKAPPKAFQKQEILRCGKDPKYFINKYVYIQHPKKGKLKFATFDYQDDCIDLFQSGENVITNKSRQLGLSTVSAAYSLWLILFRRDKNVLVIATKLGIAQNFMKKVFYAYDFLPKWLVMAADVKRTKTELGLSNGSVVKAIPTSPDAGRSEALSLLIIDEAAHITDMDEIWVGIQPTLSTGGKAIVISTPNGVGNTFHRIWTGAQAGENDFKWIELPWTVHPERDQAWYDRESANIRAGKGERGVQQEFHCSFNASGDTFLKADCMADIEAQCEDPAFFSGPKGDVWVWKQPVPNHKYLICADVSRGNSADFSGAHIIDTDTDEVVADYKGKIAPDDFAQLLMDLGLQYNTALICPELNTYGALTGQILKKAGYPNLYYEKSHKNIYMAFSNINNEDDLPGFTTTAKSREQALAKLENTLRNRLIRVPSKRLLAELKTFVWKGNKAQAMKGYNDDLVMALAIGVSLYESAGRPQYSSTEVARSMIAGMSVNTSKMSNNIQDWGTKQQQSQGVFMPINRGNNPFMSSPVNRPNPFQANSNVQNHNNEFWKQFSWVLDD